MPIHTELEMWNVTHQTEGEADRASCHSLFHLPDTAASAAACFVLAVGQESQFFFSVTVLQVHVFGDSQMKEKSGKNWFG